MIDEQEKQYHSAHLERPTRTRQMTTFFPNRPANPAIKNQNKKEMEIWFPIVLEDEQEQYLEDLDDIVKRNEQN